MKNRIQVLSILSAAAALLIGCGASAPTKELVDARAAYQEAANGKAAELVPDKLLSAKQALDKAESEHNNNANSVQEKSYSYVAQRMAELAMAQAGMAQAQKDKVDAEKQYDQVQEQMRKQAQDEAARNALALKKVKEDLEKEANKVGEQAKRLEQQKADLEARQKELEAEKAARALAEKKLAEAMKSLEEIAKIREDARGLVITLAGAVLFTTGKSTLLPVAKDNLARVATVLQQKGEDKRIVVEGHTDDVGPDDRNMKLSQDRANAVREYLIIQGVKADRITAVGKGETTPIADNKTAEGRANNRRVEIVIPK